MSSLKLFAKEISDVASSDRFYQYIKESLDKKIFDLDANNQFFPENEITRKDLAEAICRLKNFSQFKCYDSLRDLTIMSIPNNNILLYEQEKVNRVELLSALIKVDNLAMQEEFKSIKHGFIDVSEADWFYNAILISIRNNLIPVGKNDYFYPRAIAKRQELAVLITRLKTFKEVPRYGYETILWSEKYTLQELKEKLSELDQKNAILTAQNTKIQSDLSASQSLIANLNKQLEQINRENNNLKRQNNNVQLENETLKAEIRELKAIMVKEKSEKVAIFERKNEIYAENQKKYQENARYIAENNQLKQKNQENAQLIAGLNQKNLILSEKNKNIAIENEKLKKETQEKLDLAKKNNLEMFNRKEEIVVENKKIVSERTGLLTRISNLTSDNEKIRKELSRKNTEINDLRSKMDFIVKENDRIISQNKIDQKTFETTKTANLELLQRKDQLIRENKNLINSLNGLENELNNLKRQNTNFVNENTQLQAKLKQSHANSDFLRLEKELKTANNDKRDLYLSNQDLIKENTNLRNEIESLKDSMPKTILPLTTQNEISDLRKKITELSSANKDLELAKNKLEQELIAIDKSSKPKKEAAIKIIVEPEPVLLGEKIKLTLKTEEKNYIKNIEARFLNRSLSFRKVDDYTFSSTFETPKESKNSLKVDLIINLSDGSILYLEREVEILQWWRE